MSRISPDHTAIVGGPEARGVWVSPTPQLLYGDVKGWAELAKIECARIPGYWIHAKELHVNAGARPKEYERVLYYLHGGYYCICSAHPDDVTAKNARSIMQHSPSITRTFSIEYRRTTGPWDAPINPFPAALLDAIAGYNYLVNEVGFSPDDIIVAGDSSGGNLALALVRDIAEACDAKVRQALPTPSQLVLLSPWTDMGVRGYAPGSSVYTNIHTDYLDMTSPLHSLIIYRFVSSFGRQFAASNRFLSPGADPHFAEPASFEGFPRTIIISGGVETFRDQIRTLYSRMSETMGKDVCYLEFPDAVHCFIVVPSHEQERDEALGAISRWIDNN